MTCLFPRIREFSKELRITLPYMESGPPSLGSQKGVTIDCYSLTIAQKRAMISFIALGFIALLVGVLFWKTNILGEQAARVLMGTGAGVAVGVIAFMTAIHLAFIKKVNAYLKNENYQDLTWTNGNNYYEDREQGGTYICNFSIDGRSVYGIRLLENNCGLAKFHIQFSRTASIHKERKH